jgi:hypothetical protein
MAFWSNIGRALRNVFGTLTNPESPPEPVEFEDDPIYDEPVPEYEQDFGGGGGGDFFTSEDERSFEDIPEGPFVYTPGDGPYPGEWGASEKGFWDKVAEGLSFRDADNYNDALEDFEGGYLTPGLSQEAREAYRENFGIDMDMPIFENWDDFRDYWEEISPPG